MTVYHASCHCGAVRIEFKSMGDLETPRRCDCSLCRRVKPAAVSSLVKDVKLLQGQDAVSLYQFNTQTAKHYFCKVCGCHTHHQRRSNPKEMGINLGCVEEVEPRAVSSAKWVDGVNHPSDA